MRRFILLTFLTAILFAQSAPEVEITAEPHHHFAFANDQVRVFNVDVAPHTDTLMHWHRHDYFWVQLGAAEVVNAVKGKDPVTIKLQDGQTGFVPGNFAHVARNLTAQPFRNLTIEILQDDKLRQAAQSGSIHWDEDRGLNILQGGTQEILFVKDGIRASEFELQVGGVLPPVPHPHLLIAVSDVALMSSQQVRGGIPSYVPKEAQLKSGVAQWLPGGSSSSLTNVGQQTAKFVTLEWP
jgi:mannose-6-phosphate isomerase-like protein (cupin superfamily)